MGSVLSFLFLGGFHWHGREVTGISSSRAENVVTHSKGSVETVAWS